MIFENCADPSHDHQVLNGTSAFTGWRTSTGTMHSRKQHFASYYNSSPSSHCKKVFIAAGTA